jgi:hypothetical protein
MLEERKVLEEGTQSVTQSIGQFEDIEEWYEIILAYNFWEVYQ